MLLRNSQLLWVHITSTFNNRADPTEYSSAVDFFDWKIQIYLVMYLFENLRDVVKSRNCEDNGSQCSALQMITGKQQTN